MLFYYYSNDSLPPSSMLEQHVSKVRILIQTAVTEYHHYTGVISDTLSIGYEHSSSEYKVLLRLEDIIVTR